MSDLWSGFEHDPRNPSFSKLRASDRDRDLILGALGDAFADGRLTREEYDERADQVAVARTLDELPALVADLTPTASVVPVTTSTLMPAPELAALAVTKFEKERREAFFAFLTASTICWIIWVMTYGGGDFGFPWPLWVMLGTGINVARVAFSKSEIIESETKRLERKAAKRAKQLKPPPEQGS